MYHTRILITGPKLMRLSDRKLRNIKTPYTDKPELADHDVLTVRITRNAIITFNYRFRWLGNQQRIKIGCYSDGKLAEARVKSGEYRQVLQEGLYPGVTLLAIKD